MEKIRGCFTSKNLAIYILLILLNTNLSLSNILIDSLEHELNNCSTKDSISIFNSISKLYLDSLPNNSIEFAKSAYILAERISDENSMADSYCNIGKSFEKKGKYDNALAYYRDELFIREKLFEKEEIAHALNNIGIVFYFQRNYDSSLRYYLKALEIRKSLGDYEEIAKSLKNIGGLHSVTGNYEIALEYLKELLEIEIKLGIKKKIVNTYDYLGYIYFKLGNYEDALNCYLEEAKLNENVDIITDQHKFLTNIGNIYFKMQKYVQAIEYYKKALIIDRENNDNIKIAKSLSNLGNVYYEKNNYALALKYYNESLEITNQEVFKGSSKHENISAKQGKAILLNNLGLVHKSLGNYEKALVYCMSSINIKEEIGDNKNIFYPLTSIAEINLKLGNLEESLNYLSEALTIAEEKNNIELLKEVRYLLFEVYSASGKFEEALDNHLKYISYKDSLVNEATNKKISEIQIKYETKKKEHENVALREINMQQRESFFIISGLILILLAVIYSRYRSKQKANKLLKEKNLQIQKQHEELENMFSQLQSKESTLREAIATKDKFFSIIAHDLKNPLQAIAFSSYLLIEKYKYMDGEQLVSLIRNINSAGNQLSILLENLLQWSRAQSGKIDCKPQKIEINKIIRGNIELLGVNSKKKKINIYFRATSDNIVFADYNMTNAIIRNLISNAIKFSNEGGNVKVQVKDFEDDFYEISIIDKGVGISEEDLKKLFRIDIHHTTIGTSKEKGTGLGLILCKEFIEINGGSIWVESTTGKGSTFKFTLRKVEKIDKIQNNEKKFDLVALN